MPIAATTEPPAPGSDLVPGSVRLIRTLQDTSGAYPASPTFSAYRGYCWLRDGSFIADSMSAAGETQSAERFFDWCARVVDGQSELIDEAVRVRAAGGTPDVRRMPPTRFTLAGALGTDGWWDFQLDGYGTWLWALSEHARRGGRVRPHWLPAVRLTARFLVATWGMPCYDWWEENPDRRHVSTLGCVVVGLERAADEGWLPDDLAVAARAEAARARALVRDEGTRDGHLVKWLGSDEIDASVLAMVTMGYLDGEPETARATVAAVRSGLTAGGGVYRFARDVFYGGGRWPLLTCLLGLAELRLGDAPSARERLAWAAGTATADGELPEQVDGMLLAPGHRQEWLDRWGPVATPLLWSHAMYVRLAVESGTR